MFTFQTDGVLVEQEEKINNVSQTIDKWEYNAWGDLRQSTDPLGRKTTYMYDYQLPAVYLGNDSPDSEDEEWQYDPNDYQGNVAMTFSLSGLAKYYYETDDEEKDALGALLHQKRYPKINATGIDLKGTLEDYLRGGPEFQTDTYYTMSRSRQLLQTQRVRGLFDSSFGSFFTSTKDAIESWEYNTDGYLFRSLDVSNLETKYTYVNRRVETAKVTDYISNTREISTYEYDANGFVDKETKRSGAGAMISLIDYDYDPQGNLAKQVVKSSDKTYALVTLSSDTFEYNSVGQVKRSTNGLGLVTDWWYNNAGQVRMQEVGVGAQYLSHFTNQNEYIDQTTIYDYYDNGTLSSITLPSEDIVGYLFDPVNLTSWERTNNVAGDTTALGGTVQFVDDNFLVTENITDNYGRMSTSNNRLTGARTTFFYDDPRNDIPTRNKSKTILNNSGESLDRLTSSKYDADGRLLWQQIGPTAAQIFRYDSLGYVYKQVTKAAYGAEFTITTLPSGAVSQQKEFRKQDGSIDEYLTSIAFDSTGRAIKNTDPLAGTEENTAPATVKYEYDQGLMKITSTSRTLDKTITWQNGIGQVVMEKSPLEVVTSYLYDLAGNVTETYINPPDAASIATINVYDKIGRLRQTTVIPDGMTPRISYTDPMLPGTAWSTITTDPAGVQNGIRMDSIGQVIAQIGLNSLDPSGNAYPSSLIVNGYSYNDSTAVNSVVQTKTISDAISSSFPTAKSEFKDVVRVKQLISDSGAVLSTERSGGYNGFYATINTQEYDTVGRMTTGSLPPTTGTTTPEVETLAYDDTQSGTGKLKTVDRPLSDQLAYDYDSVGNQTKNKRNSKTIERLAFDALNRTTARSLFPTPPAPTDKKGSKDYLDNADYKGHITVNSRPTFDNYESSVDLSPATRIKTDTIGDSVTTTLHDSLGRVKSVTPPGRAAITYEYFADGTLKSLTDGVGQKTSWTYDIHGRPLTETDPSSFTTVKTYDLVGNLKSVTAPNGNRTVYVHDSENRIISTTNSSTTNSLSRTTQYTHDPFGNRLTLTDPNNNVTTWTYDDYDRVLTETSHGAQPKSYKYDAAGRLVWITKPDQNRIHNVYDGNGYKITEEWSGSSGTVTDTLSYEYDALGNMTLASDAISSVSWLYVGGYLRQESVVLPTHLMSQVVYRYKDGLLSTATTKLTATVDSEVKYSWTPDRKVERIQQTGTYVSTKSVRYDYDEAGRRKGISRYSQITDVVPVFNTEIKYRLAIGGQELPRSISHQRGSETAELSKYSFTWDNIGRLETTSSLADGLAIFTYDTFNQLKSADYANIADLNFDYDANGNRNSNGNTPGVDNRQEADSAWTFGYDPNGNMTSRTNKTTGAVIEYEYDTRDRLIAVRYKTSATGSLTKVVKYGYDAIDRRISETVDTDGNGSVDQTDYFVNQGMRANRDNAGDSVVLKINTAGQVVSRILHGALVDEVLAEENVTSNTNREVLWTLPDHQGSIRDLAKVDSSGNPTVVNHIMYDAFGNNVAETDEAIKHMYGYTGREFDKQTGLQYNRARYYDPSTGRFLSKDPIGFAAGDTNLYRMTGNHPNMATDPSGLWEDGSVPNGTIISTMPEYDAVDEYIATERAKLAQRTDVRGKRLWELGVSASQVHLYEHVKDEGLEFYSWVNAIDKENAENAAYRDYLRRRSDAEMIATGVGMAGGVIETWGGAVIATAGLGTPVSWFGGYLVVHGVDRTQTAMRSGLGDTEFDTFTSQTIQFVGVNRNWANRIELAVDLGGSVYVGFAGRAGGFLAPSSRATIVERSGAGLSQPLSRTANLPSSASMSDIISNGWIPGREGITISDRFVRFGDMFSMSKASGVEFGLTRETLNGRGVYRLYSGGGNNVRLPSGPGSRIIGHTHPRGTRFPSTGEFSDIDNINNAFLRSLQQNQSAPMPHRRVIWGEGNFDSTIYYPNVLR